jgi:hypothetical protein
MAGAVLRRLFAPDTATTEVRPIAIPVDTSGVVRGD